MKAVVDAKIREYGKKNVKKLRMQEKIPAVVYGKGVDSKSIFIDYNLFRKTYMTIQGKRSFIFLKIEGEDEEYRTLIKEMQIDPVSRQVTHIDFQIIFSGQVIEIDVPVKARGEAPGIKEGGLMEVILRDLTVKCLPKDLPEFIEVDIGHLQLNESVHISDILENYPDIEILQSADSSIIAIVPPFVEPEEEEEEEELEEPELVDGEVPETEEGEEDKEEEKEEEKEK